MSESEASHKELPDYARWNPHIHTITADGLFTENGTFYVLPKNTSLKPLAELFRASVLKMLKKEKLTNDDFIRKIMQWRHTSGFSVDNSVCIARGNNDPAVFRLNGNSLILFKLDHISDYFWYPGS